MTSDILPIFVFNVFSAFLHGVIFVVGFILLKLTRGFLGLAALIIGLIAAHIISTFAVFFLQGSERALSMILPSGEMFVVLGMPVIINAVISTVLIMLSAYALLVVPGIQKND